MDTDITQLAKMMRARRAAGVAPYTLLLGSSLSLTPAVRRAVCDSEDWEAFWETVSRTSPAERRALMHEPLSRLDLQAGCDALAQLVGAGYFNVVLTLNVDDALDNALKTLPASEYRVWVHGEVGSREIVAALDRPTPRIKMVKLRGDVNAYKLPLTPEATFEFPHDLEEALTRYLRHDTVIVGDLPFDDDVQRCIKGGDGALWVIVAEESDVLSLSKGGFLGRAKRIRKVGEVIAATEFNAFFTALAEVLGLGEAEEAAPEVAFVPPEKRVNPYRGLEPFEPEHARYFFGREVLTEMLAERLQRERFLAVLGASGSGKSSVVRAGVLPALAQGKLPGSGNWPVLVIKPGQNPQEALAGALAAPVSAARSAGAVDFVRLQETRQEVQERLLREESALHELVTELVLSRACPEPRRRVEGVVAKEDDDRRVVVVIDQFEELFTLCPFEQRQRFIDALLYAVGQPDGHTTVLLTLRADFVAQCTAYPDLSDLISNHQVWVRAMDDEGLRAAIERPAWLAGMRYEPGLVPLILADVGREPGALPLLEDALWSLFEYCKAGDEVIELREYREIGGVQGALAKRADDVYATLTAEEQGVTRRILLQLVEMREGQEATRRRTSLDELVTVAEERALMERVVQQLTDARLLTTTQEEETGRRVVDISHEALIQGWPRLQGWIDADRAALLTHRRLTEAAEEWERHGRDESYLDRGARLAEAEEWAEVHANDLNALEREFLATSQVALAERRAQERRAARFRLGALAAIALLIMGILAAIAIGQNQLTQQQREAAQTAEALAANEAQARDTAEARQLDAENAKATADYHAQVAEQNAHQAQVQSANTLAGLAAALLDEQLDLSLLLSNEAIRISDTYYTRNSLLSALQYSPRLQRFSFGHCGNVNSLAVSPDGQILADGSCGFQPRIGTCRVGEIALWDMRNGLPLGDPLRGHSGAVSSLVFSPDGKTLVSGSGDGTILFWNMSTRERDGQPLEVYGTGVTSLALSSNGQILASGHWDDTLILWDMSERRAIGKPLRGHTRHVTSLAFSPDGEILASGSDDQTIILWDSATGQPLGEPLQGHSDGVTSVVFNPDGDLLASGSDDTTVRLWDPATGQPFKEPLQGHSSAVRSLAFSPDGKRLASGSADRTILLWDLTKRKTPEESLIGHSDSVTSLTFSRDGQTLASGSCKTRDIVGDCTQGELILWNTGNDLLFGTHIQAPDGSVWSVAYSLDGNMLASGSYDGTILLWDMTTHTPLGEALRGKSGLITFLAFGEENKTLISGVCQAVRDIWDCIDGEIYVWDLTLGQPGKPLDASLDWLNGLAVDRDGQKLAVASCHQKSWIGSCDQAIITLWDLPKRQRSGELLTDQFRGVSGLAFSPDGEKLASVEQHGRLLLWDLELRQPEQVGEPFRHTDNVTSLAFSPDGKTLATGSLDHTVQLWDSDQGIPLGRPLPGHEGWVDSLAFSPNGKILASGSHSSEVILWDVASRQPIGQPMKGSSTSVQSLAFSPDGNWLAAGSCGQRNESRDCILADIILWDLDPQNWLTRACQIAGRSLTTEEWQLYFPGQPYHKTCPDLAVGEQ